MANEMMDYVYMIVVIITMIWVIVDCVAGIRRKMKSNRESLNKLS